ncbi:hypothetical protein PINS_up001759 [Pythium insidiosum]|nr:hypothetical protein PINS_up001759 [Pythium insidiosum]
MSLSRQLEFNTNEEDDLPPTQDMTDDVTVEATRHRSDTLSSQSSVQGEKGLHAPTVRRGTGQRRVTVRWTRDEEDLLVRGVQQYGEGHWAHILELGRGIFLPHRTNVDLKDKWKNLSKQGMQQLIARADANALRKHRTKAQRSSKKSARADADEWQEHDDRVPSKKRRSAPPSEVHSSDTADVDVSYGLSDHSDRESEQADSAKHGFTASPAPTQVELQIATDTSFPHVRRLCFPFCLPWYSHRLTAVRTFQLLSIVVDPRNLSTVALLKRELNKRFLDDSPLPTNLRLVSLQSRRLLGDLERLEECLARDGHQFFLLYDP